MPDNPYDEYDQSLEETEAILFADSRIEQEAVNAYRAPETMKNHRALRGKNSLRVTVQRHTGAEVSASNIIVLKKQDDKNGSPILAVRTKMGERNLWNAEKEKKTTLPHPVHSDFSAVHRHRPVC